MNSSHSTALSPIAPQQRIEALDVVRGFALFGIFLMNIEFFNRSISGIMLGMPTGLTGLDWWASWFIAYFVQGKFWTIFSLLFGMGFAVMLTRSEQAGRDFMGPYLRRILGLAVFGAAHYIFLWSGDILFSYAVAAGALLILLYGQWKQILLALAVLVGIGFIPDMEPVFCIAGALAFVALNSLYLRAERRLPLFSFVLLALGTIAVIAAVVLWSLPNGPKEPRIPVTVASVVLLILSALSARFYEPASLRELRLGVTIYTFAFLMMTVGGAVQFLKPHEPATAPATAAVLKTPAPAPAKSVAADPAAKKPEPSEAEKAAEKKAERAKRLAKREEEIRNEVRILSNGHYAEAVDLRARRFPEKVAGDAGFAGQRNGTEHHLLGAIRLAIGTGHAVGVGHVAGDCIEALRLRAHARTGDIEYIE